VTYVLQIKDRHNGNILLDRDGHLVHIDFGFMLSNTPGNIGFEASPFKFPAEYMEVLGGINGSAFLEFKALFRQGFELARKHCDRIISMFSKPHQCLLYLVCFSALVELMQKGWYHLIDHYCAVIRFHRLSVTLLCRFWGSNSYPSSGSIPANVDPLIDWRLY
jgi:hypothetical protein